LRQGAIPTPGWGPGNPSVKNIVNPLLLRVERRVERKPCNKEHTAI